MVFTAPVHKDRENSLFWKGEMGEDEDQSKTHTMCRNSKSWFSVGSMSGFVWDALHSKHLLYSSPSTLHRSRHSLFLKWCLFCARSYLRWLRLHFYNSHKGILGLLGRNSNPVSHGLTSQILRDYREKKIHECFLHYSCLQNHYHVDHVAKFCCKQNTANLRGLQFNSLCAHFPM